MNIQQINSKLSITGFLASHGIQPAHRKGCDWWYISPVRMAERTPSFKVNTRLNRWYDHGSGEGGKLFDLAMRLHRTASIREVIQLLSDQSFAPAATPALSAKPTGERGKQENPAVKPALSSGIQVLGARPLEYQSPLADYLQLRGIPLETARPYCHEVCFSIGPRQHEAVGFVNRSGGYELRNNWFKGSSSPKDITLVDNGSQSVCLLEGFMDFLSLLELRPHLKDSANFVILNSLALLSKSMEVLNQHRQVLLFLDHDQAGRRVTDKLLHSDLKCADASSLYRGSKDINEFLIASKRQAKRLRLGLGASRGPRGKGL